MLQQQLDRIQAVEELRQRQATGSASAQHWFNLILRVTGSEDEADRAAARYMLNELRAGRVPS